MATPKLYPSVVYGNPPSDFSDEVDAACNDIHSACKGFGTNEEYVHEFR